MSNKIQDSYIENPSTSGVAKRTVKLITASTYLLLPTDKDKKLVFANACTVTVPTGLDVDEDYILIQKGSDLDQVSLIQSGTVVSKAPNKIATTAYQNAVVSLLYTGENEYLAVGELAPEI